MAFDVFGDTTFAVLGKALDAYSLRHRVSANNIANANTPGFKRSYVSFEAELGELVRKSGGDEGSLLSGLDDLDLSAQVDQLTESREDGNNVDMEQEIAEMSKNNIRYAGASSIIKKKLEMYRYVISEGRR